MSTTGNQRHMMWMFLMVFGFLVSAPMAGAAPPSKDAKEQCSDGGYLHYTDADGNSFKNASMCAKSIADGGIVEVIPYLKIVWSKPVDGRTWGKVTGEGLLPGATVYAHVDGGTDIDIYRVSGDGTLAFVWGHFTCGV